MCLSNSGNVIENEKTRSILPVGNRDPERIFTNFSMTYQSRINCQPGAMEIIVSGNARMPCAMPICLSHP
jgi:hypothetical protein